MSFEIRTRPRAGGVWGGMRAGFGFLFSAASKKERALALFLLICYHYKCKGYDAADTAEPREESLKEQVELSGKYPS